MTCTVTFDPRPSLDIVDDLLAIAPSALNLSNKPSRLIIVPDRLSKRHLVSYICKKDRESVLNDFFITTSEDLAGIITSQNMIIDSELLHLILTAAIMKLNDPIAEKIRSGIKHSNLPHDSPIIEALTMEFNEYVEFVKGNNYSCNAIITKLGNIPKIYNKRMNDVLIFFERLLTACEELLNELNFEDLYLTRAHLVADATSKINELNLADLLGMDKLESICLVGVNQFDNTLLNFILTLMYHVDDIIIGIDPVIGSRLRKRLDALPKEISLSYNFLPLSETNCEIKYFSVPDKRREVELAAVISTKLLSKGTTPDEVLILSRLASDYQPYFKSVFTEYGIPSFMRVREALTFSPVYRLIESLILLLVKVETGKNLSAEDISRPLRLGFPIIDTPLDDERFLAIETELESMEHFDHVAPIHEWIKRIMDKKNGISTKHYNFLFFPVERILKWVTKHVMAPDVNTLIRVLRKFIDVYGVEKNYPLLEMISTPRLDLTIEHISSQANRVLDGLWAIFRYYKRVVEVRKQLTNTSVNDSWTDILRAYRGVVGGITYGHIRRDADSILFVDVGISHFIDAKCRLILGMTNDQFPRKYPDPFLIFPEMRELLNKPESGLFILSSVTQEEIERSLFSVAKGRATRIMFSMNFLDDRGHKQNWSVFVNPINQKLIHAHELKIELSSLYQHHVSTSSISTLLHDLFRFNKHHDLSTILSELCSIGTSTSLPYDEIVALSASVNAMMTRVLDRKWNPYFDLGPTDVVELVFNDQRTPHSWEIDLLIYCPRMYYFYVFYHLLPFKKWIETHEQVSSFLEYIPSFKKGFIGELPPPLWRIYFSTRSTLWLLEKLNNIDKINDGDLEALTSEIESLKISLAEKSALSRLLISLSEMDPLPQLKPPSPSSQFNKQMYRPLAIRTRPKNCIPVKFGSVKPFNSTILKHRGFEVVNFGGSRNYVRFNDIYKIDFETSIIMIKSHTTFTKIACSDPVYEQVVINDICSDCPYRTLCGNWGF